MVEIIKTIIVCATVILVVGMFLASKNEKK
jgi:hypothetical protein